MTSRTDACGALCRAIIVLLVLLLLGAGQVLAREVVPAPVISGPGQSIYAPDNMPSPPEKIGTLPVLDGGEIPALSARGDAKWIDDIGGDDLLVLENNEIRDLSMDIAANGDIYLAITREQTGVTIFIEVYRSTDNGQTWELWGTIGGGDYFFYREPHLRIIEGDVSGCFVLFSGSSSEHRARIMLISSPLGGSSASWNPVTIVMQDPGIDFQDPRFDTDVYSYSDFFVYVIAEGEEVSGATGQDIWFARSIDQGATFETPYMLATLAVPGRNYGNPDISYGYGGHLHACWDFQSTDLSFDASVRYRRASNYASGGVASWDNWVTMTSTSDGYWDIRPSIEGGHTSNNVVLSYVRLTPNLRWLHVDTLLRISSDTGVSW
jgi:hypothetical protein